MHEPIKPLIITHWAGREKLINIALRPQNPEHRTWQKAIEKIGIAWKEIYPADDVEINFLDEQIAKYYEAEQHISSLLIWASGLSIFISCLGLLGLIIYITNQRTKEIGIRKVIGASVSQIISLLSKDFLQPHHHCISHCRPHCMVQREQMAGKFCLPDRIKLVDFSGRRHCNAFHGITHISDAYIKSCNCKSCQFIANRIKYLIMLKNYLKISLRHAKKNKGFSLINILGLSLGMTCAILILLVGAG